MPAMVAHVSPVMSSRCSWLVSDHDTRPATPSMSRLMKYFMMVTLIGGSVADQRLRRLGHQRPLGIPAGGPLGGDKDGVREELLRESAVLRITAAEDEWDTQGGQQDHVEFCLAHDVPVGQDLV